MVFGKKNTKLYTHGYLQIEYIIHGLNLNTCINDAEK